MKKHVLHGAQYSEPSGTSTDQVGGTRCRS